MNTNEWCAIDNTYYGKEKISPMLWNNNDVLKDNKICASGLGLIAILTNEEPYQMNFKKEREHNLKIYSSIGRLISSCRLNYDKLICFGWNKNSELVLLFNDNIVRVYSCYCEKLFVFSLDENIKNEKVLMGHICDEGIVIITEKLKIYVNYYFSGNNCIKYPSVDLKGKPNCIGAIDEDKVNEDLNLNIHPNYFDNISNNDILKLNFRNYITNPFDKKDNAYKKWNVKKGIDKTKVEAEVETRSGIGTETRGGTGGIGVETLLVETGEVFHNTFQRSNGNNERDGENRGKGRERERERERESGRKHMREHMKKKETYYRTTKNSGYTSSSSSSSGRTNSSRNTSTNTSNSKERKKRKKKVLIKTTAYQLYTANPNERNYGNTERSDASFTTKHKDKRKKQKRKSGILKKDLNIHVLIALSTGGFVLINKNNYKYYDVDYAPYIKMAISKSGNLLAMLSTNGIIKIYLLKNLNKCIEETILDNKKRMTQMEWCGDDCLAVYIPMITPSNEIQHMLFIGGPKNQWIPYQYRSAIFLMGDVYGVKIWSKEYFECASRIKKSTFNIFSIGSCTPSAMLFYAYEKFKNGNMSVDDEIRAFDNNLNKAIEECLEAVMYEYNEETIQLLLQTSLFGKKFLKNPENCTQFLLTCLYLRISLNVRKPPLDIFISAAELKFISIPQFASHIVKRKEYLWAYRICKYAGISTHHVLMEWCKEKIEKSIELTDEQLCTALIEKIQNEKNIDYSYIAFIAAKNMRPQLATIIIQYEEDTKKQIQMLLKLANYKLALEKAVLSKNMELVYLCIINILSQEKMDVDGEKDLTTLKMAMANNPIAAKCFYVFCKKSKQHKLLKRFYEKNNQHYLAAFVTLDLALSKTNFEQKKTWLAYSAGFLTTEKMNSHLKFVHSSIMNHIDLLNNQKELEIKYNKKSVIGYPHKIQGLSLMKTIEYVISVGEFIDADNIYKKFKIPDAKYWMCKVYALAKNKYFDELFNFANYRSSPIGLDYFIECAYEFGSITLAVKLIQKLKDLNAQYKWFLKLKMQEEAEKVLQQIKSQKLTSTIFQTISDVISNIR